MANNKRFFKTISLAHWHVKLSIGAQLPMVLSFRWETCELVINVKNNVVKKTTKQTTKNQENNVRDLWPLTCNATFESNALRKYNTFYFLISYSFQPCIFNFACISFYYTD